MQILDSSALALIVRLASIAFIQPIAISLTPLSLAAFSIVLKAVLSKAPSMSMNTAIASSLFLKDPSMLVMMS